MKQIIKIGFIGLGQMGMPMAKRLVGAGFSVYGVDLSERAKTEFQNFGGISCDTPNEAASEADLLITMLPNGKIVKDIIMNYCLDSYINGTIIIDMSSSAPNDTVKLSDELQKKGYSLLDAPVSGGTIRATNGTLSIMVGGSPSDVAIIKNILIHLGNSIIPTGIVGSGHAMKALNNFVSASGAAAAMEALFVGEKFGLNPNIMVDILNQASGKNNTTENKLKQFVLSGTFKSGFDIGLMSKDISIANDLANGLNLDMNLISNMNNSWMEAMKLLGNKADHTEYYKYIVNEKG